MKTYVATPATRERNWLVVDATGKTLGRLATQLADALRGKRKPEYTPHVDVGDFVIVVNAEKISVTGNKREEKRYYRHSGYPGGLRRRTLGEMLERRPEEVIRLAVKGMLPRNRLARAQLRKLKVYAGPDHPHIAQKPEPMEVAPDDGGAAAARGRRPRGGRAGRAWRGDPVGGAPEEQPAPEETPAGSGEEHPGPEIGGMEELAQAAGEAEAPAAEEPAAEGGARRRGARRRGRAELPRSPRPRRPARRAPAPRRAPPAGGKGRRRRGHPGRPSRAGPGARGAASRRGRVRRVRRVRRRRRRGEGEPDAAAEEAPTEEQPAALTPLELAADARYRATGKRKSAVARVMLKPGKGAYTINGRHLDEYFPRVRLQRMGRQPLEATGNQARMDVVALIHGGGVSAQAAALRHGIARALVEADPALRGELKRRGYLTRDPRVKERKKAGLKKARKRPQFSKR